MVAEPLERVWGEAWGEELDGRSRLLPRADLRPGITVAIPALPVRPKMLAKAVGSVLNQTRPADAIAIAFEATDKAARVGAPANRDRALAMVETTWTAFLDDDDDLGSLHLEKLEREAERTGADLVFPWFHVVGPDGGIHPDWDPFPMHFGREWDITPDNLDEIRQFPITVLVRTNLLLQVGGFAANPIVEERVHDGNRAGEDLLMWAELVKLGAKIVHLPERTWFWHHHGRNTSGVADRW